MMTLVQTKPTCDDTSATTDPCEAIVAREGSPLAARLRACGWVARSGWRSTNDNGSSAWYLRFERADATQCVSN